MGSTVTKAARRSSTSALGFSPITMTTGRPRRFGRVRYLRNSVRDRKQPTASIASASRITRCRTAAAIMKTAIAAPATQRSKPGASARALEGTGRPTPDRVKRDHPADDNRAAANKARATHPTRRPIHVRKWASRDRVHGAPPLSDKAAAPMCAVIELKARATYRQNGRATASNWLKFQGETLPLCRHSGAEIAVYPMIEWLDGRVSTTPVTWQHGGRRSSGGRCCSNGGDASISADVMLLQGILASKTCQSSAARASANRPNLGYKYMITLIFWRRPSPR